MAQAVDKERLIGMLDRFLNRVRCRLHTSDRAGNTLRNSQHSEGLLQPIRIRSCDIGLAAHANRGRITSARQRRDQHVIKGVRELLIDSRDACAPDTVVPLITNLCTR